MSIKIALAGNPNCGKTTLFNALTGANQYVGNWPGVTVEKKEGKLKKHDDVIVTDLPGIYSLSPYTLEEVVARKYLIDERPDAILNIVDGTNLERNLYLTTQLTEIGIPVVIAINMMDMVKRNGDEIDTFILSKSFGCRVIEISAAKGEGLDEAALAAIEAAKEGKKIPYHSFSGSVEHALAHIEEAAFHDLPEERQRWYAIKFFERDPEVMKSLSMPKEKLEHMEKDIRLSEREMDDDSEAIIISERYNYIESVLKNCYKRKNEGKLSVSDRIDAVLTNRWLSIPLFAAIMFLVYYVSISAVGGPISNWISGWLFEGKIQPFLGSFLSRIGAAKWVISLVADGIVGGLAAPVAFVPQMALLFFFLCILEDCGYMSRIAFIMDNVFRRFGLSGKSFISLLVSSGCGVPGIMSCRTIENEKDRRLTMVTATCIPCGAKLPVIALISGYIGGKWWMAPLVYFCGIIMVIISCLILKKSKSFSGDPAPFVMELPAYHFPSAGNLLYHVWDRVWSFLKKIGTVLFICCIVMWILSNLGIENGKFGMTEIENSLLAKAGGAIAFIFKPLGFGSWRAVSSSLTGFVAKEGIVSTIGVLTGNNGLETIFKSNIAAISFLFFNLFNSPCIAAIATMAKEIGSKKYFFIAIAFQNVFSYCISLVVYQIVGLFAGSVGFGIGTVAAIAVFAAILLLIVRKGYEGRVNK